MRGRALVSVTHGHRVASVVRDERGEMWLGDDRYGGTLVTDHRPAVQGLEPDVTIAGGRLPPGAVRAIVWDRTGREHEAVVGEDAWLAVLAQPVRGESPVVRFADQAGELVAVPLPAGVELAPVGDAREPCPACGAADWGRVVAAPAYRYGTDGAGRPTAALCRRCGHEESLGVLFGPAFPETEVDAAEVERARAAFGSELGDPEVERAVAALGHELDAAEVERARAAFGSELGAVARSVPFTLYGLAGHRATAAGHGAQDGCVDSVTLAFMTAAGEVHVETSVEEPFEPAEWVARHTLEGLLHEDDAPWPQASETAVSLWLNGRSRAHAAVAAAAPVRTVPLKVAGSAVPFATVAPGDRFAAFARLPGASITVTGRGDPAELELDTVASDDIAA